MVPVRSGPNPRPNLTCRGGDAGGSVQDAEDSCPGEPYIAAPGGRAGRQGGAAGRGGARSGLQLRGARRGAGHWLCHWLCHRLLCHRHDEPGHATPRHEQSAAPSCPRVLTGSWRGGALSASAAGDSAGPVSDGTANSTMYFKPPHRTKWEMFQSFLYDRASGRVFGRTGSSWAKIGLFYAIFYAVLASMFAIMLWVFFQTLDPRIPRWQLTGSLIGTNPGMGFRPLPPHTNVDSTLIWYRGSDPENYKMWRNSLVEFLEVYRKPGLTPGRGQNIYNCDYDRPPGKGQVCDVDVKNWAPCTQENNFNYHKSGPCIFLKLNKIYGWVPSYYNDTRNLPAAMPKDLKTHIEAMGRNSSRRLNTIWVSCEGENPADVENIGPVKYLPSYRGFPGYFYPYENTEGYLSPLIAVHFERPRTGVLIQIECKAWAKNIGFDRKERVGSVHFELMID